MAPKGRQPAIRVTTPWTVYVRYVASERGLNFTDLAQEAGLSRSTVQRWLSGVLKTPDIETAKQFAARLGLNPMDALRAAGHLSEDGASEDWELDMIRQSGLPEGVIDRLVADTLARREAERAEEARRQEMRRRELARLIDTLHGATGS
jgi:transcriptional regulator with XRE-family HTH domain